MTIDIPDGKIPRVIPMSRLSEREKEEAKNQTNELISKGWIRRRKAQAPANVLFVKKPHSQKLRMCMDYGRLNAITIKDKYPVPIINDPLDKLRSAKYFIRLNTISAYNMISIAPDHEWKMAFQTPDGCFEWLFMPFGLANSPPTWQSFIDQIFRDVSQRIVSHVDDFLIYAKSKQELHHRTVDVLKRLIHKNLYCFMITEGGLRINPKRVATITDWPIPQNLQKVQQFVGFTNFYRRFISQYSKISAGISNFLREEASQKQFNLDDKALQAFNDIKNSFAKSPMLQQWDPNLPGILETDSSGGGISGILSQRHNRVKKPVAFWGRKLQPEETRYGISDQEHLAVVDALMHFRVYLEGAQHKIQIFSDHTNLQYFKSTIRPNRRQSGYLEKLAAYQFDIYHCEVEKNPADAPSRRPDYMKRIEESPTDWDSTSLLISKTTYSPML
ncbi:hypothetical protein K3495_g11924 [Podosphaera aphanis]|nr:hypothetical protein K3495_g11924 [Podosphaera aphanis]